MQTDSCLQSLQESSSICRFIELCLILRWALLRCYTQWTFEVLYTMYFWSVIHNLLLRCYTQWTFEVCTPWIQFQNGSRYILLLETEGCIWIISICDLHFIAWALDTSERKNLDRFIIRWNIMKMTQLWEQKWNDEECGGDGTMGEIVFSTRLHPNGQAQAIQGVEVIRNTQAILGQVLQRRSHTGK